jgi:hypothetical protein
VAVDRFLNNPSVWKACQVSQTCSSVTYLTTFRSPGDKLPKVKHQKANFLEPHNDVFQPMGKPPETRWRGPRLLIHCSLVYVASGLLEDL